MRSLRFSGIIIPIVGVLALAISSLLWASGVAPVYGGQAGFVSAAHGAYTCAVTSAGGIKCWGFNHNGQLGNGTTTNSSTPVQVAGLTAGFTAVSPGGSHTCAVTSAGGIKCWGSNLQGQLVDGSGGSGIANSSTPVQVADLTASFTAVSSGGYHTCALTTVGGIKCWGSNAFGELGSSTTINSSTPLDVVGFVIATAVPSVSGVALVSMTGLVAALWLWRRKRSSGFLER